MHRVFCLFQTVLLHPPPYACHHSTVFFYWPSLPRLRFLPSRPYSLYTFTPSTPCVFLADCLSIYIRIRMCIIRVFTQVLVSLESCFFLPPPHFFTNFLFYMCYSVRSCFFFPFVSFKPIHFCLRVFFVLFPVMVLTPQRLLSTSGRIFL